MNTNELTNTQSCSRRCSRRCHIPLCWALLIAFDVSLMALTYAQDGKAGATEPPVQSVETEIPGPVDVAANVSRFEAIDVFVDSGNQRLAAWQLEVRSTANDVQIVGIEGGEHPAFSEPPYYDKRAMNNNRVIIAAFSTDDNLPSGRSRVARIHVQVRGSGARAWLSELTTSATTDGTRIPAEISITKAAG
ncbi:MAG: hypothetical protein WKF77_17985 [Planctomycetaceae bacterium]